MSDSQCISLAEPTVFVLGAGASHAYGFPLGSELKARMLAKLGRGGAQGLLAQAGFGKPLVQRFAEALKFSQHGTIDIFLEHKTSLRKVGAYLIAITIMPLENPDRLFPVGGWYSDFLSALRFDEEQPDVPCLGIVTLNYDRSFEHFMTKTIDFNVHDDRVKAAHAKRAQIPVVHAHGSLGRYPAVPYGIRPTDADALRQAAESIRIVSDRLDDSEDFRAAQALLEGAKNIVFLGFGYDHRTLTALLRDVDMGHTRFFGTTLGLTDEKKKEVADLLRFADVDPDEERKKKEAADLLHFGDVGLGEEERDCAAYLQHIGITGTPSRPASPPGD